MSGFKSPKFQLIECAIGINVTGNMQLTAFGQQPQLQSISGDKQVYIKAIETYTNDMIPFSPLTPANPVATAADIANGVLILNIMGILEFNLIPLGSLVRIQGTISQSVFELWQFRQVFQVDWTKSQVQTILKPITTPPFSYLFGVHYDYTPDQEDVDSGYQTIH
jgi:hypothetical protein